MPEFDPRSCERGLPVELTPIGPKGFDRRPNNSTFFRDTALAGAGTISTFSSDIARPVSPGRVLRARGRSAGFPFCATKLTQSPCILKPPKAFQPPFLRSIFRVGKVWLSVTITSPNSFTDTPSKAGVKAAG